MFFDKFVKTMDLVLIDRVKRVSLPYQFLCLLRHRHDLLFLNIDTPIVIDPLLCK